MSLTAAAAFTCLGTRRFRSLICALINQIQTRLTNLNNLNAASENSLM